MKAIILKDMIADENYQLDTVKQYQQVSEVIEKLTKILNAFEEKIKAEAKAVFDKDDKLVKVDVEGVTVTRERRGYKTPTKDLAEMYADGVIGVKVDFKMDTKVLNDYVKANGRLPEGWVERVKEYLTLKVD